MQKKVIKRKSAPKQRRSKSNSGSTKEYSIKRKPQTSSKAKNENINVQIACWIGFVALLLLCYLKLGLIFTLITAVGIGIIVGVAHLLRKAKNDKKKKKIINIILIIILGLGILCLALFAAFLVYITVTAPEFDAKRLDKKEMSLFYDKDEKKYAESGDERREKISYEELPQVFVDALVATEDSRFFEHNGFDAPRFLKASMGQLLGNSDAGGASTISMQVIKNTMTSKTDSGIKGIIRKFTDIYLAIFKLEKNYTKEQIIEFYVNNHGLGGMVYGVEEAAQTYFGKSASDLNLSEAATLAGMFQAPTYYKPDVNPENAEKRRSTVLYLMVRHGYITQEEADIANSIPVEDLIVEQAASSDPYQGYLDTVISELEDKYNIDPSKTPVEVYTNLDRSKQEAVNSVMNGETYTWIDDKVQAGVTVLDSETGKVLAIGAGRNRIAGDWNFAVDNKRQPGSTAKPLFDYGPGIEYNNWSTYQLFDDSPYTYTGGRPIKNWDNGYFGTITLRRALSASRNIPALKAFQQVDNNKIKEFVTNLGITPEICNSGYEYDKEKDVCINPKNKTDTHKPNKIHEAHSIGAFSPGVSSMEMAGAYAAFSNGGYYNEPHTIEKIVFRDTGEVIEFDGEKKKVMSDATAFMISDVLQDVALTGGTPTNVAAKTGTTNYDSEYMEKHNLPGDAIRDSWVVGYSTKTVIALWYGYQNNDTTGRYVLHNVPATIQKDRIFNALVKAGAMESNREAFKQPSSVVKLGIISGSNPPIVAGSGYTGSVVYEYFKKGHEPEETDLSSIKLGKPGNLKVSYDESSNKVTLSWSAVDPGDNKNLGTFGYNVYIGSTLIAFTENTSYTYTLSGSSSPYGTYKVVATFKGYSGVQGTPATYILEEPEEEEEEIDPYEEEKKQCVANGDTWDSTTNTCTPSIEGGETPVTP